MGNLSELLPTGGGQNAVDFVASGTLSSGQTVVLNSDGTISPVEETTYSNTAIGAKTGALTGSNKIGMSYIDDANSVITIGKGTSNNYLAGRITYLDSNRTLQSGSMTVIDSSVGLDQIGVGSFLNSKKFIALYRANYTSITSFRVCENTSGGTISVGSSYNFFSGAGGINGSEFPQAIGISDTKILCSTWGGSGGGMVVGVVDISSGTPVVGTVAQPTGSTRDSNSLARTSDPNKFIASWSNSGQIYACVVTVSGNSVSFGTVVNTSFSDVAYHSSCCYDAVNDQILFVATQAATGLVILITGSVSGTSLTLSTNVQTAGVPTATFGGSFYRPTIVVPLSKNLFGVCYAYARLYIGNARMISYFSMSGQTATNESNLYIGSGSQVGSMAYSVYQDAVFNGTDTGTYITVTARDYPHTASNNTDFIGITDEAIADTATGAVNVYGGINSRQSGLAIGSDYYVQDDGSLSTTASDVKAGQAISATTINMMDLK